MAELKSISIDGTSYNVDLPAITSGLKTMLLDQIYPIGSIYMSVNSSNPGTLFGGTWQQLKDRFLLGAGDTYAAGAQGGEASHTITTQELPYLGKFSAVSWASGNGATNGIFSKQFMYKDITAPSGSAAGTAEFTAQGGGYVTQQYATLHNCLYVGKNCVVSGKERAYV